MTEYFALAPVTVLILGGLLVMLADAFAKERVDLAALVATLLGVSMAMATAGLVVVTETAGFSELVTRYLAVDAAAQLTDVVLTATALIAVLAAGSYLREHDLERPEFYLLLLFSTFGAMILARALDLLTLFIGLETMSLAVYGMIAMRRRSARSIEAATKYFLLGSFAAAIFLFGAALVYGATGETSLVAIRDAIAAGSVDPALLTLGLVFTFAGFAFKIAAAPFHGWAPDAYEGAMIPATGFMSVVVKAAAFAALLRVFAVAFGDPSLTDGSTGWPLVVGWIALLSMITGNFGALRQSNIKRMLAYSGVAHAGYLLLGLASLHAVPEDASAAILFYFLAYGAATGLALASLVSFGSKGLEAVDVDDLVGLGKRHPLLALPMALAMLSLLGIPPTAGFFSKLFLFQAAAQAGGFYALLALAGIALSVVSGFYYLRIVVALYATDPAEGAVIAKPMRSGYVIFAVVVGSVIVIKLGVMPGLFLDLALEAGRGLFH
jgi:NADH-quinone oxidoreductase subunit N